MSYVLFLIAGGGAAVDRYNSNITFLNNYFGNNSAPAGGAVIVSRFNFNVVFIGDQFIDNWALVDGGAIYCHDTNRGMMFEDVVFDGNRCIYRGGGKKIRHHHYTLISFHFISSLSHHKVIKVIYLSGLVSIIRSLSFHLYVFLCFYCMIIVVMCHVQDCIFIET